VDPVVRTVLFSQLADAVSYLHRHKISHRDIKPPNVLVTSFNPPLALLTDFGCASDEALMEYTTVGTITYLAPEQVQGKTHTHAVDLWALGLVGSELMGLWLGKRAMPGEDDFDNFLRLLEEEDHVMARCCRGPLKAIAEQRMPAEDVCSTLKKHLQDTGYLEQPQESKRKLETGDMGA
jgi:serine/threonine protein kinase